MDNGAQLDAAETCRAAEALHGDAEALCIDAGECRWDAMKAQMAQTLGQKRFRHSLAVADTAVAMGRLFGGDLVKLALAGLLHDAAKELGDAKLLETAVSEGLITDEVERESVYLLHGPVAAWMLRRDWGIEDPTILEAIRFHTTGAPGMCREACIIFMADLVEPGRTYQDAVILRQLCREDLRAAMLLAIEQTYVYLARKNLPLHGAMRLCHEWLQNERSLEWKAKKWR